jgi:16S rRNA (guanine527-N7)-methyltransferase
VIECILKYFPDITDQQKGQLLQLFPLYSFWNMRINVISRRDTENLYLHHVLHSLSIARVVSLKEGSLVLDAGTGGGFPGIPLAILFPEARFHLVDSIGKKTRVVDHIVKETGLVNVFTMCNRVENITSRYDYIVSRAVAALPLFLSWCQGKIRAERHHQMENGILYLKGGDLTAELRSLNRPFQIFPIEDWFSEPYFREKKIVFIPFLPY